MCVRACVRACMCAIVITVLLVLVDGDRTRGRTPRRWVDDIIDWCGCALPTAVHLTVNRIEWNEKTDDVVAGLDGSPCLWVHGLMDGVLAGITSLVLCALCSSCSGFTAMTAMDARLWIETMPALHQEKNNSYNNSKLYGHIMLFLLFDVVVAL